MSRVPVSKGEITRGQRTHEMGCPGWHVEMNLEEKLYLHSSSRHNPSDLGHCWHGGKNVGMCEDTGGGALSRDST